MGAHDGGPSRARGISRRVLIGSGVVAAGAVAGGVFLGRRADEPPSAPGWIPTDDEIVFLSTQLTPVEEAEAMRNAILTDFPGRVEFVRLDDAPFLDRALADAQSAKGTIGVLGGQHGHFASLQAQGLLADLTDLADELEDRRFIPDYLVLGEILGEGLSYIPWMQASYIMVARRDALEYLPYGTDENALRTSFTYEQLGAWAKRIADVQGPKLGLPAGDGGLLHRFLQGYSYPSFTRGVNTTFRSDGAVSMWQWLRDTWRSTNPESTSYDFMQEPLRTGEVWVAWDHTARLIDALRESPDDFVTFPAPRGPAGLGYMPVLAGLAIPKNAPDTEASRALIEYLTRPAVQAITAREVSFFPTIEAELPEELPVGIEQEAEAINATLRSDAGIPSLLPVGLGDQNQAYNTVFRDAFRRIVLDGEDIRQVLDSEAQNLQRVLDMANVACWPPDRPGSGVCRVG